MHIEWREPADEEELARLIGDERDAKQWDRYRMRHAGGRGSRCADLPKRRDECWYLITDLAGRRWKAKTLSDLYARRMSVEELFGDQKGIRNG